MSTQHIDYSDPLANKPVPDSSAYYPCTSPSVGALLPVSDGWTQNERPPKLFTPIKIGPVDFKNRVFVAPMCQYSCETGTGLASAWHFVHLGAYATRGAALVMTEAAAVTPNGRITPEDLGLWNDEQKEALRPIIAFIKAQGARAGIQLAHAGRKASTLAPWVCMSTLAPPIHKHEAEPNIGGWKDVWAPSAVPFREGYPMPQAMTLEQIKEFKQAWVAAVKRAADIGVDVLENHVAHGYLLHEFLSPLSNKRTDHYGGSLENRMRLVLEILELTRANFSGALFVRISASDWHAKGERDAEGNYISWGIEQSKVLQQEAIKRGCDLIDASSGGLDSEQKITIEPGYQVPFAEQLRNGRQGDTKGSVSAVGLITNGKQAEEILQKGQADVITVAREFLRDADLVFNWAQDLGVAVNVPVQYQRAHTRMFKKPEAS